MRGLADGSLWTGDRPSGEQHDSGLQVAESAPVRGYAASHDQPSQLKPGAMPSKARGIRLASVPAATVLANARRRLGG